MADTPQFDESQPFTTGAAKPVFDETQPFQATIHPGSSPDAAMPTDLGMPDSMRTQLSFADDSKYQSGSQKRRLQKYPAK